jgi:hypothetical protein
MNLHLWLMAKLLRRIARNAATCTMWKPVRLNSITRKHELANDGLHFHTWRLFGLGGISQYRIDSIADLMENEITRREVFRYQVVKP